MTLCGWCGATGKDLDEAIHRVAIHDQHGNFAYRYFNRPSAAQEAVGRRIMEQTIREYKDAVARRIDYVKETQAQ